MEKDIWTGGESGRWTIGLEGESHNDFSFGGYVGIPWDSVLPKTHNGNFILIGICGKSKITGESELADKV